MWQGVSREVQILYGVSLTPEMVRSPGDECTQLERAGRRREEAFDDSVDSIFACVWRE